MFQDSVPAGSYNDPFLSSVCVRAICTVVCAFRTCAQRFHKSQPICVVEKVRARLCFLSSTSAFCEQPDWLCCCPLFVSGCNCACLVFACVCSSWLADGNSKFHTALFFWYVNHPVALKLQEKSTIEHSCYGDDVEPVLVTHKWPLHCLSVFLMCYSGQPNRTQQLRNRIERVWNRSSVRLR